jgi:hypothetical protein
VIRKLVASLGVTILFVCLLLLTLGPALRLFSTSEPASPTPSAVISLPTSSPTPTAVPLGLRGAIVFGTSVFRNDRGLYIPTVRSSYRFPSSISWMAYLSQPVRRVPLVLEIVRFQPGAHVISQKMFHIGEDSVRIMPFVISPDEWRSYGFTRPGVYGVRYSTGKLELAEGIFRLT